MRAFAQSIVETVRHPMLILDGDLRVNQANGAFYRLFGLTRAETAGRSARDLGAETWATPKLAVMLEEIVLHGGSVNDVEVVHEVPELGRRTLVLDARRVIRDDDGAPMILVAFEDITERRQARDELRRLNGELEDRVGERTAQLEASNRELEAFCYSVSHDLRAPLRALDGFSEELLRSYPGKVLDEKGEHYLRRLRSGTQRMGQLIDDLLKLSRLTRAEVAQAPVDLTALAESVADELRQREPTRQVTFAIAPGLATVGDGALLRVALENLLNNAWKFTAKKAQVTITFGRAVRDGRPAFAVGDDGAGFDMAHVDKLFGAFQRLHPEREFPGNGVGLATVQRIIHRHGGQIWAEGSPGHGATFTFTLPAKEPR